MNSVPNDFRRYAGAAFLVLITVFIWFSPLDQPATASIDNGMQRAFVTFAAARGLNAAISMVQGTEVTVGVGIGATFSVGEVLDPINDLVEQFAELMLLAAVSFGVQKMLLVIGQHDAAKIVVIALVLAWAAMQAFGRRPPRFLTGLLILGLMMRFAVPVATVGTDAMFRVFLDEQFQASEQVIAETRKSVEEVRPDAKGKTAKGKTAPPALSSAQVQGKGVLDIVGEWFGQTTPSPKQPGEASKSGKPATAQSAEPLAKAPLADDSWFPWEFPDFDFLDPTDKIEELKIKVERGAEHIVRLIVVFLFQTLFIPLAILWILYRFATNAFNFAGRDEMRGRSRERPVQSRQLS